MAENNTILEKLEGPGSPLRGSINPDYRPERNWRSETLCQTDEGI